MLCIKGDFGMRKAFSRVYGARLGTPACGVRAEPSARVTNKDWWLRHMGLPT